MRLNHKQKVSDEPGRRQREKQENTLIYTLIKSYEKKILTWTKTKLWYQ